VSLDTELAFTDARRRRPTRTTTLNPNISNPKAAAAVEFPHAVLEVKLHEGEKCEWIDEALRAAPASTEVYKFSKFLHGTVATRGGVNDETPGGGAFLWRIPHWFDDDVARAHEERARARDTLERALLTRTKSATAATTTATATRAVEPSDGGSGGENDHVVVHVVADGEQRVGDGDGGGGERLLPSAAAQSSDAIPSDPSAAAPGAAPERVVAAAAAEHFRPSFLRPRPSDPPPPPPCDGSGSDGLAAGRRRHVPIKVEPKTFFANERTLLQARSIHWSPYDRVRVVNAIP